MKTCTGCNQFDHGVKVINDQQIFCANQSAAPKTRVEPFVFCPWCGETLTEKEIIFDDTRCTCWPSTTEGTSAGCPVHGVKY